MIAAPNALKLRRIIAGLKQHELAELLGMAESTYSKLETGRRLPTEDEAKKLAKKLGCKPDKLLDLTDITFPI